LFTLQLKLVGLLVALTVVEFILSFSVEYDAPVYQPFDGATRVLVTYFQVTTMNDGHKGLRTTKDGGTPMVMWWS
jgi:hypothetical protein